ncbi:hypothetical protein EJB05_21156, partial [Eragrostis curvula]
MCIQRAQRSFAIDRTIKLASAFNQASVCPSSWLAGLVSGNVRRAEAWRDTVFGLLDDVISEHLERTDDGRSGGEAEDLLDVLLKLQKSDDIPFALDMDVIKAVVFVSAHIRFLHRTWTTVYQDQVPENARRAQDIFGAGIETTTAMQRATAEVRRAFEAHGAVHEHRLTSELRYLRLVVRETPRLHPPAPLLLPRESREPSRVLGYDVPRGATVLVNVGALGRDERCWPCAPEEFRPERFEDAAVDLKGADFELLPFGAGRRMCPGMAFGLATVDLALASLLFHFDWEAPGLSSDDPAEFDMTESFGITTRPKAGLLLRRLLRVPVPRV